MKRLYFDTETTDVFKPGKPHPRIVQLAALLYDDDEGEIAHMNVIIQPSDWEVGEGAFGVHGISTAKATRYGIPLKNALSCFTALIYASDQIVAHNYAFDGKLLTCEYVQCGVRDYITERPHFCTMEATTNICKIPGNYGKYKWPKLQEAHKHFFGVEFDGAHDALADVKACQRIHQHLISNQLI
jgi:DNA polymerase-3 subunit epsilon